MDTTSTGIGAARTPAIAVSGLTKRYGEVTAVDSLTLEVAAGSVTGLLGGSGAGKTTTIAMLMGLVLPTAGSIRVLGVDMLRERGKVLHRINFQSPYVDMPMRLTVKQNLTVFGRLYGLDRLGERIGQLAEDLDLTHLLDRPCGRLSAGQKTRVGLAKALINMPELLLLDEPTASLDPDTADWVRTHLEEYRAGRGATILLASHNMPEVERLCDRVLMMKAGRIVDDGSPQALIARYGRSTLEDVFLDVARGTGRAGAMAEE
jgi:ABC-2 type transport system ATP-binding protein